MTDTPSAVCRNPRCRTPVEPGYAPRGLCQPEETAGLEAIQALPGDYAALQPLVWDKPSGGIGTVGTPFGPTVPINLAADELANEIAYTAVVWEITVRERVRLSEAPDQQAAAGYRDLCRAATILAAHYSVLLALPSTDHVDYHERLAVADGVEAILALTALHRRARIHAGITSPTTTVPGLCGECDRPGLQHRDGADTVYCRYCHAEWDWATYRNHVAVVPFGEPA